MTEAASGRPRLLVAPDSFKGTFDAPSVARAIGVGIEAGGGSADLCPVADGGEGTMAVLLEALGGELRRARVHDPLRRPIEASFALLSGGETAVVEVAQASGLPLLAPGERDPERADSFGTGELIAAAAEDGATRVLLAAGGSATVDGGRGAIGALADADWLERIAVEILCDVDTAYEDAARVFGPQKGADAAAVVRLGAELDAVAAGLPRDPRGVPMGGAAGGLSGGLWAHGATLRRGAAYVLDAVGFGERLERADVVVAGEGRLDSQSFEGKIVGVLAERCAAAGKPLHLVVGENALPPGPPIAFASVREAGSLEEMRRAGAELAEARP